MNETGGGSGTTRDRNGTLHVRGVAKDPAHAGGVGRPNRTIIRRPNANTDTALAESQHVMTRLWSGSDGAEAAEAEKRRLISSDLDNPVGLDEHPAIKFPDRDTDRIIDAYRSATLGSPVGQLENQAGSTRNEVVVGYKWRSAIRLVEGRVSHDDDGHFTIRHADGSSTGVEVVDVFSTPTPASVERANLAFRTYVTAAERQTRHASAGV
jgi:hypothetical protein